MIPGLRIVNLHNIEWTKAPIPPRDHECWAQTAAYDVIGLRVAERCPCGGIRLDADNPYRKVEWIERNSRRNDDEPIAQPKKKWWHRK